MKYHALFDIFKKRQNFQLSSAANCIGGALSVKTQHQSMRQDKTSFSIKNDDIFLFFLFLLFKKTFAVDVHDLRFGAQLIGPIQLHDKRQISNLCIFFQGFAWTFSA